MAVAGAAVAGAAVAGAAPPERGRVGGLPLLARSAREGTWVGMRGGSRGGCETGAAPAAWGCWSGETETAPAGAECVEMG